MADEILLRRDGALAFVTLNRPDKHNAFNAAMWDRLAAVMAELAADDDLRCVVLSGAGGKAFSAGADIGEFEQRRSTAAQARAYATHIHGGITALASCRHPTIAAVRGLCVGGGLEVAASCDLRIAGAGARFGVPVKRLGLVVAYPELTPLVRLVGPARAKEILLEGNLYGAADAERMGLVNRVVPDDKVDEEAAASARRIAEGAPLAARWHKKFVDRLLDPAPLTAAEREENYRCFDTEDFKIGRRAFVAKTPPKFVGR